MNIDINVPLQPLFCVRLGSFTLFPHKLYFIFFVNKKTISLLRNQIHITLSEYQSLRIIIQFLQYRNTQKYQSILNRLPKKKIQPIPSSAIYYYYYYFITMKRKLELILTQF